MTDRSSTEVDPIERIIWSADVPDRATLFGHVRKMRSLRKIKVDRLMWDTLGPGVVDELRDLGLDVFDDGKLVEIPTKLEMLAKVHVKHRPWMLNCMAGAESSDVLVYDDPAVVDGLKRFADVCLNADVRPCGVTVLTTTTPEVVGRQYNGRTPIEQVLYYVEVLLNCGFTDVVCSPREAEAIRSESRFDCIDINAASIRMPDDPPDDQARTRTPREAVDAGVTRLIIGRPITLGVPTVNIERIVRNIKGLAA